MPRDYMGNEGADESVRAAAREAGWGRDGVMAGSEDSLEGYMPYNGEGPPSADTGEGEVFGRDTTFWPLGDHPLAGGDRVR